MSGLVAALNVAATIAGTDEVVFPADTAIGSLVRYVTTAQREFAPMNATWGLFPPLDEPLRRADKRERARSQLLRARPSFARFLRSRPDLVAPAIDPPAAAERLAAVP
jgi:methylenetetrahydrofolate--tRNA-(uracil-5-)-methyltransferase